MKKYLLKLIEIDIELSDCEEILLTKKVLFDLGFTVIEITEEIEAVKFGFRYSFKKVKEVNHWWLCDEENVISNLKYVHQLQNLYFALTGKELVVSDPVT